MTAQTRRVERTAKQIDLCSIDWGIVHLDSVDEGRSLLDHGVQEFIFGSDRRICRRRQRSETRLPALGGRHEKKPS